MIVIFCDNIDDFIVFLEKRIMNEIFYEMREREQEIVLHFLAKVSDTLILYETKQNITKSTNNEEIITSLENIFTQVDPSLKLITGKIREIFLSYSS